MTASWNLDLLSSVHCFRLAMVETLNTMLSNHLNSKLPGGPYHLKDLNTATMQDRLQAFYFHLLTSSSVL